MKSVATACLLAIGLILSACGTSPVQACIDQGKADCNKMWTCDASVKIGNNETDCNSTMEGLCKGFAAEGKCQNGKNADLGKQSACTADIQASSCDAYKSGSYKTANCNAVCGG